MSSRWLVGLSVPCARFCWLAGLWSCCKCFWRHYPRSNLRDSKTGTQNPSLHPFHPSTLPPFPSHHPCQPSFTVTQLCFKAPGARPPPVFLLTPGCASFNIPLTYIRHSIHLSIITFHRLAISHTPPSPLTTVRDPPSSNSYLTHSLPTLYTPPASSVTSIGTFITTTVTTIHESSPQHRTIYPT